MTARLLIILFIVLLLGACGSAPETKLAPPAIKVGAVSADNGDIVQTLDVSGNLHFIGDTTLAAEVSAQVKTIDVRDGQPVIKGQVLLTFDDSIIRATADQARGTLQKDEANLAFNKSELEKNVPLQKTGAISQSTYDQKFSAYQGSVGQVEADKGALAKALEDLKHCVVRSPITGLLANRYVEIGDWAPTAGKLFQIGNYTTIYVGSFLSDKDVSKLNVEKVIKDGQGIDATVMVDSLPDKVFEGQIGYVQPVTNQNRLFEVRIYIDNRNMTLLEGMYARARTVVKKLPGVVRVPIDGLLEQVRPNAENAVVRVSKESQSEITRIKIGDTDDTHAQVMNGLQPGDHVVVQGKEVLSSGQRLEVTMMSSPANLVRSDSRATLQIPN